MALTYGTNMTKLTGNAGGVVQQLLNVAQAGGRERVFVETIVLAAQAAASTIAVARLPKGAAVTEITPITDTSLGTATIAFGDSGAGNSALFAAATTLTAVNTPTKLGKAIQMGQPVTVTYDATGVLAGYEDVIMTTAVAALPGAGNLTVITRYTID